MSPMMLEDRKPYAARSTSFEVSEAQYEDISRLVDIEFEAFEKEKTNHILSYRDSTQPAHLARTKRSYQSLMKNARQTRTAPGQCPERLAESAVVQFWKVTDRANDRTISWAKTERKAYSLKELSSPKDCGHEGEPRMNREWFALNERSRRDYMATDRHCYIAMVATEPAFQHRGAATMVLETMLAKADRDRDECYLEATDTAKPLYEKHGFVAVNELRFDPAEYGVHGYRIERQTIMVRGALDAYGVRQKVRPWPMATPPTTPPAEE